MQLLVFKNVTKAFGSIIALDNVSFEIEAGDFVFLTGPSGAGKSTLLKLIIRELRPDSGQLIFDGEDIVKLPESKIHLLRQKVGFIFQDYKILPERTVRENIELALAVKGVSEGEWKKRVQSVLDLVGLAARVDLFPAQLSGGELQRASLARALVINPRLILADEPTGNLDWETADSVMDLFDRINKEGKTILMATHNRVVINKFRKRVIELREGKLVDTDKHKKKA